MFVWLIFDVLIGVNLLREGLDLPQVSLVAIIDADKEGFLRSERALTQTAGRAARNINGLVIMYADKITNSMQQTINETNRRRKKQETYNIKNGLVPKPLMIKKDNPLNSSLSPYQIKQSKKEDQIQYTNTTQLKKMINRTKREMERMAKNLNFIEAIRLRDQLEELEKKLKNKV